MNNYSVGIEIEKKYIIEKPDIQIMRMMESFSESSILQIYLCSDDGITHRVRRRICGNQTKYIETKKIRIDKMSSTEMEREISKDEFDLLASNQKSGTTPINKIRYVFRYAGQIFEIDVYPEWKSTAIMETELENREVSVKFPDFIKIVRDVTGEKRYSNASMSASFPEESSIL